VAGSLAGLRVLELAGLGPVPFAAMMLADMGAEVVRIDRLDRGGATRGTRYLMNRGRRSAGVDLKHPDGAATVLRMADRADVLIEGFRPGTMERLGLGPQDCLTRNPRLVYGRMTGWGQDGPLASTAGHDLTYLAVSGALSNFARAGEAPVTPPNGMVADLGGGGLMLAFGVVCAVLEAQRSGQGQVIDAAMVDGAASLTAMLRSLIAQGRWHDQPGTNFADGGSHYYNVYETADGKHVAVAAIEPPFYRALLDGLGLDPANLPGQDDQARWPEMKGLLARIFRTRSRDEWAAHFTGTDACVAPVLSLIEAARHPHTTARGTFAAYGGVPQPAPAPRLSRTPGRITLPPREPGQDTDEVLARWGFGPEEVSRLRAAGAVG
jgi:alpha-methylacyl-CoA racemase